MRRRCICVHEAGRRCVKERCVQRAAALLREGDAMRGDASEGATPEKRRDKDTLVGCLLGWANHSLYICLFLVFLLFLFFFPIPCCYFAIS
jgi:hypothetical protein